MTTDAPDGPYAFGVVPPKRSQGADPFSRHLFPRARDVAVEALAVFASLIIAAVVFYPIISSAAFGAANQSWLKPSARISAMIKDSDFSEKQLIPMSLPEDI
jgi:hypothetical protein